MKQILPFTTQSVGTNRGSIVPAPFTRSSTDPVFPSRRPLVSPSLRLRATAANRSLLRWMRAVELEAWQDSNEAPRRALNFLPK
jgi:hypothetical protein